MTRSIVEVRHNAAASQFEATVEGWLCIAAYTLVDGVMRIHHTEVPPAVGNRGIAAQIVRAAFSYAEAQHLKVEPRCSYVRSYMRRHPETLHLLPEDSTLRH
ncbi:MAG TPA: GNAT family N-acetyltransferase [Casimicrobiaceae bacterium]|nr:GNAT family N-acetyltransferase [Casimicrobiaceae bacterium]